MVTIITLTGGGDTKQTLSMKEAARYLIANSNRYLVVDWGTKQVIHKDRFETLADDAVIGLIPQIVGG